MSTRIVILAPLALVLFWAIVSSSFGAYLANVTPSAALYLNPNGPSALLKRAQGLISADAAFEAVQPIIETRAEVEDDNEPSPVSNVPNAVESGTNDEPAPTATADVVSKTADPDVVSQIELLAARALAHDPLNAKALRMLGQASYASGNDARGDNMMEAASQRSLHESLALYAMVRKHYRERNYPKALSYADALLRTRVNVFPDLMPMLGRMAEDPEASTSLKHMLSKDSPWRSRFFSQLPKFITDARTPLGVFLAVNESSARLSEADLRSYLTMLINNDLHELAYYAWLQFLPPEQMAKAGFVFNGDFDTEPTPVPFDWQFAAGSGANIQRAARPDNDDDFALLLQFGPGRVEQGEVKQMVMLPRGDYRLSAVYKSDLTSDRGVKWSVTCVGDREPLGDSIGVKGVHSSWKELEFAFTVPDNDCVAQTLKLALDARSASEKFADGSIWYDAVRITRQSEAEQSQE
jgi:hypothetical protein